eukprot:4445505-Pleurochrysis_carterae.AAC.3
MIDARGKFRWDSERLRVVITWNDALRSNSPELDKLVQAQMRARRSTRSGCMSTVLDMVSGR